MKAKKTYHALQSCIVCSFQFATDLKVAKKSDIGNLPINLLGCPSCGSSSVVSLQKMDPATAKMFIHKGD